jgi:hypothetical protein
MNHLILGGVGVVPVVSSPFLAWRVPDSNRRFRIPCAWLEPSAGWKPSPGRPRKSPGQVLESRRRKRGSHATSIRADDCGVGSRGRSWNARARSGGGRGSFGERRSARCLTLGSTQRAEAPARCQATWRGRGSRRQRQGVLGTCVPGHGIAMRRRQPSSSLAEGPCRAVKLHGERPLVARLASSVA